MWKRFVGFVWDDGHNPVDPGFGGGIGAPVDPGYGRPDWGGRPDNSLPWAPGHPGNALPGGGHISTGPIYGGGHPGNKPPGRPILPPRPGNKPPVAPAHPWLPGRWEILDPGWGKPPLLGFIPVDPGWGMEEGGSTTPPVVDNSLPGGQWVPTDPDYGLPERCPGGKPHPPIWAWIPKPPDLSKPVPEEPAPTPQ